MAELQFPGLLPDLVHGEVHDPAELIPLHVHVAGAEGAQLVPEHARRLLGGEQLTRRQPHEAAGGEAQSLYHLLLDGLDKFGDAAHDFTLLIVAEPVRLVARLDLHLVADAVDLLPGALKAGHHDGLDGVPFKGPEAAPGQ